MFGNGKTAVKASFARYVNGVGLAALSTTDNANPEVSVGQTDTRAWKDLDGNGSPFNSAGQIQLNELTNSTSTPSFGKNQPASTTTDPSVLNGWGKRGYNTEWSLSVQQELMPRVSLNGGWFRRSFGNQTVTVDNRYNFTNSSFDGPFCANAPADPNLPGGGGYQVCGLYDIKQSSRESQPAGEQHDHVLGQLRRRDEYLLGVRRVHAGDVQTGRVRSGWRDAWEAHVRPVQPRRTRASCRP